MGERDTSPSGARVYGTARVKSTSCASRAGRRTVVFLFVGVDVGDRVMESIEAEPGTDGGHLR